MAGEREDRCSAPAIIRITPDDGKAILIGGRQIKAGSRNLFPHNLETKVFVTQSGPDHSPHIGFDISIDHGELDSPHAGAHFEVQTEIQPTKSYNLSFVAQVKKANLKVGELPGYSPDRDESDTIASRLIDANKNGASLVALRIALGHAKFELVNYPPTVARGPNYDVVHNDQPFDNGATVSKILSSSSIIAYVPRADCEAITNAFSRGKPTNIIEKDRPWGIQPMHTYKRQHLERIQHALFRQDPVPVQRITDWEHYRAAIVLGMGADTLRMQQDIEKLSNTACRAILGRTKDGTLIAGFEPPPEEVGLRKLLASLVKGGRKLQVCRLAWPSKSAAKPKLEECDPFPASILDGIPEGINFPPNFHIVAQLSPSRVGVHELSDLIPSDGETEVDLWLHFPDCTKQTERFIASFSKRLDEKKNARFGGSEHGRVESNKARTRNMLCGRGARRHLSSYKHLEGASPPYPPYQVNLVAEASSADSRTAMTIMASTIGQLGPYSELVKSAINALPDGILAFEGFPGSGKTTVTATIAAFLCLVAGNSKSFKITVIASQHAALDAFNIKLDQRLESSVAHLNKELRDPVRLPLVLRVSIDDYAEMMEFVRIVESGFELGPDPNCPNTLCELMLQLLHADTHHLPECSKPELISFANKIICEESPGYHRLRKFAAGQSTWDEANLKDRVDEDVPEPQAERVKGELSPQSTAKKAVQDIMKQVLPLVDILICTTAAAASGNWAECVENADVCIVEEAAAMSCPEVFAAWRGIGQILIISGDSNQFGPFDLRYEEHKFQEYLSTSTLHTVKTAGYPIFQLTIQHRAIDGQFDLVYKTFYSDIKPWSPESLHPRNHPDARRVEAAFVKDCGGLFASPAELIIPMFINVPNSHTTQSGHSRQNAEQAEAALCVVNRLRSWGIKESEIMVIAAYRAGFIELQKILPEEISVMTVDVAQGQERAYVVLVFSTTEETGLGFTGNPHRLCVALSRQKAFLALVGDIDTVKNSKYFGTFSNFFLEGIHRYLVLHNRVGDYRHVKKALEATANAPQPSPNENRDEEEKRLQAESDAAQAKFYAAQAELDAAMAKLKNYQASKAKPPNLQRSEDPDLLQPHDADSSVEADHSLVDYEF